MKRSRIITVLLLVGVVSLAVLVAAEPAGEAERRSKATKLRGEGNFKDAYEIFSKLARDPKTDPQKVSADLGNTIQCLRRLNRINEIDAFREQVIKAHAKNWRLLWTAARTYLQDPQHYGYMIAGEFRRGGHRGGGKAVNSYERDRVRGLQLMVQAMKNIPAKGSSHVQISRFYLELARQFMGNRGYSNAWRLQYKTDLSELPDYEDGHYYYGPYGYYRGRGYNRNYGSSRGAPVDAEGNPVYYTRPKNWQAASNDGQRWRWCLLQAVEYNSDVKSGVQRTFADFLYNQFGVQTMAWYRGFFNRSDDTDQTGKKAKTGTWELHTLKENETIAKLATGVKRFTLPDEFDFIKIYKQLNENNKLAEIFENRRQYPKAVEYWKKGLSPDWLKKVESREFDYLIDSPQPHLHPRLQQLLGNWGHFEPVVTQPAGRGATVQLRFRNGKKVSFTAHAIKIEKLLGDVKAYIKTKPRKGNWDKVNIGNIGYRLITNNQAKYIGKEVAKWSLDLKPRPAHFDKRITVTTPLQKAGAYLLTAKMADGNTSNIVLWLADTAIVKKALAGKNLYFIADAVTGKPIAKANVEFFGFLHRRKDYKTLFGKWDYYWKWEIENFADYTDKDGLLTIGADQMPSHRRNKGWVTWQWMVVARTEAGRLAYMGFSNVWYSSHGSYQYGKRGLFMMTDRPVYRPKQKVHYKFWANRAAYDVEGDSPYAGQSVYVRVNNPKGEKVHEQTVKLDKFGGAGGELSLAADATLGVYHIAVRPSPNVGWHGGGNFRVEEYKKPEYEVKIEAPTDPVALGEKITATIEAKYFFGAPVTEATVKYKILRSEHDGRWYPYGRWDWLFGRGYWWFGCDYYWYPGWGKWGCCRPIWPWWGWRPTPQPELVAEAEVKIGADGKVKVVIDTALAKAMHGDRDHKYEITAEVRDASRRTIVGTGSVLVARRPFKVYAWVDRGFYVAGDTVRADFQARRIDGKGVKGKGTLRLMKLSYEKNKAGIAKPVETLVQKWNLDTDENGKAGLQIKAAKPGQYRLSYKLTDAKKHTIEGGYVFTVWGADTVGDASSFRFNAIELLSDKKQYVPGDKLKLRINTNQIGSTVLLFVRPAGGVYFPPKMLHLKGKSIHEVIEVAKKDMPNFFIEVLTVSGGKVHTEVRQIVVPPEKRVLDVKITPTKKRYKPGEKAKVKIKLIDSKGEPFSGSVVLTMYDKAVEYISGGSNVANIKDFFWKWKRSHSPNTQTSLNKGGSNIPKRGQLSINWLGVFGHGVADEPGPASGKTMGGLCVGMDQKAQGLRKLRDGKDRGPRGGHKRLAQARAPMALKACAEVACKITDSGKPTGGGAAKPSVQPTVRTKFADTAKWVGCLTTGKNGCGVVELTMPENLTTWKTMVWAMGAGCRVGQGSTEVITTKNLIVRLQAPRFFVQTDEVVLSANVMNYLQTEKKVKVSLDLAGDTLEQIYSPKRRKEVEELLEKGLDGEFLPPQCVFEITIPAGGTKRVDWWVKVVKEGKAKITMKAITDEESDAMAMSFPVYVHGMLKTESFCGVIRPDGKTATVKIRVPKARRPAQSRLELRYSPTLAGAMLDALPYTVGYPYGCTEQTLNRFIPTVITQKVLQNMGVSLKDIQKRITNLNAQEIGDDVKRMKDWKRLCGRMRWDGSGWVARNPVFDKGEVDRMVKAGLARLTSMQCSDGGWGWFSGWGERSYPHTTAVVVHGLLIAKANDVAVVPGTLNRGVNWLKNYQARQVQLLENAGKTPKPRRWKGSADSLDALVYMVLNEAGVDNKKMREFLYRDRVKLPIYAKCLLGLACHKVGDKKKLDMIMKNIGQYLVQDDENQTCYLRLPENNWWWYWYGSEIEAQAWYLKLLAATDPKGKNASRLVKYLLNNRRHGTYWNSTRDTAYCIEAFADYIKKSGEDKPDMTVEILIDGKSHKKVKINKDNLFSFDNKLVLTGKAVTTGEHVITIKRTGSGPVYFNAYLTNFTLENPISKAGLEIKVRRKYYKLVRVAKTVKVEGSRGQALDQKVEKYKRIPIPGPFDKDYKAAKPLKSGDLVEIELIIESKNDYEYIMFQDYKAAGFEPVALRSGYSRNEMGAYMELRDNRVCFFVRALARGKHSMSYRMRAEIPGKFSALPTKASAMYAPELRANSDEMKVQVTD